MQLHSASKAKDIDSSSYTQLAHPDDRAWSYSPFLALVLSALVVFVISTTAFYFAWDYMPGRVRYIPRYIEARFLPERPHDEFVAAPAVSVLPEEALQSIQLGDLVVEDNEAAEVPDAQSDVAPPPVENQAETVGEPGGAVLPATDEAQEGTAGEATEPVAEAPPVEGAAAPPAEEVASPAQEQAAAPPAEEPVAPPAEEVVTVQFQPPQPAARLDGLRHEYQGWNNCGPATLAMNLSFFGRQETQYDVAPFLKPDEDDKNVSPNEMVAYAHSVGLGAKVIVGADLELLRTLVTNGLPVVVESWYIPEPDDQMGHYLLLRGYENDTLHFLDSYAGPNVTKNAAEFDELWKVFNRTAIVIWTPENEPLVTSILGERMDPQRMYERALATAHSEVNANPQDKFAWFNLGTNLTALGQLDSAVKAFDTARSLQLPWRMLWYQFAPYEAYFNAGNYQEVVNLATTTLNGANNLEESYFWRGRAYAALGQISAARSDFQQAVRFNPNFAPAQEALAALPQ